MPQRGRAAATAPLVGIAAAMAFSGALAAPWVERRLTRTVGDVAVGELQTTTGMELVPLGVVAGLAAVLCGIGVLVTRRAARRGAAVLLTLSGAAAIAAAALGVTRALAMDARLTAAPWVAGAAAAAIVTAGVLGWRPAARRMPARYDIDATTTDGEWQMATDPGDARRLDGPAS